MKYLLLTTLLLLAFPVFAYDYADDHIQLSILSNGNWELTLDGVLYNLDWVESRLRTAGLDGTCYWYDGLEITDCTLQEYSQFLTNK